jgi:hypothetical protein
MLGVGWFRGVGPLRLHLFQLYVDPAGRRQLLLQQREVLPLTVFGDPVDHPGGTVGLPAGPLAASFPSRSSCLTAW